MTPGDDRATLVCGPGPRLALVARLARALAEDHGLAVRTVSDVDEFAGLRERVSLCLVDADLLASDDLGIVRRFVDRRSEVVLGVVGAEPGARVAKALGELRGARWIAWPIDLAALESLVASAARPVPQASAGVTARAARHERPSAAAFDGDEIRTIEAILSGEVDEDPRRGGPAAHERGHERVLELEPARRPAPTTATLSTASPAWREQIANLADHAQRLELALRASEQRGDRPGGEELAGEVARIVQFARTLGYLAAPPPRGEQVFDLGETLHTLVATFAQRGENAPRCQFRATGATHVRSERELLTQAFDAFFHVAHACARAGEVVRVQVRRAEGTAGALAATTIEFPAGPLDGWTADRVLEPYALRRVLPDLGPNALAAAVSIVRGQGGQVTLGPASRGRLEWRVELPSVAEREAPVAATASAKTAV